jgi:hypothetical protein
MFSYCLRVEIAQIKQFYLPEDAVNKVEEMYHPMNFRTKLCVFKSCKFKTVGKNQYVCAFAHDGKDLRVMSEGDYTSLKSWKSNAPQQAAKMLHEFVPRVSTPSIPDLIYGPGTLSSSLHFHFCIRMLMSSMKK